MLFTIYQIEAIQKRALAIIYTGTYGKQYVPCWTHEPHRTQRSTGSL